MSTRLEQDFELIAGVLASRRLDQGMYEDFPCDDELMESVRLLELEDTAHTFADALATANPNFDRVGFLKAAGVYGK